MENHPNWVFAFPLPVGYDRPSGSDALFEFVKNKVFYFLT